MEDRISSHKYVRIWLFLGLILVFGQILIGGVTRLTGSGLSITKWEIITGAIPPLSESSWKEEFLLYQQTPQYRLINKGMTLSQFKVIYFWEYLHRLWARWMGLIFLFPFLWFWWKGYLHRQLMKRLGWLIGITAVTASFGWIMVASGLIERPWVNAYKLSVHLILGFSVFVYLLYILVHERWKDGIGHISIRQRRDLGLLVFVMITQIFLGGMMSGMKAGFAYPTWPDMHGTWIPDILMDSSQWTVNNFVNYDDTGFLVALVQWLHRNVAYLLIIIGLVYYFSYRHAVDNAVYNVFHTLLIILLVSQICLGILTILGFQKGIPIVTGSMHQMCALLLLSVSLMPLFWARTKHISGNTSS